MLLKSEYSFDINKAKQITTLGGKKKLRKKLYEMNTVYGRKLDESKAWLNQAWIGYSLRSSCGNSAVGALLKINELLDPFQSYVSFSQVAMMIIRPLKKR